MSQDRIISLMNKVGLEEMNEILHRYDEIKEILNVGDLSDSQNLLEMACKQRFIENINTGKKKYDKHLLNILDKVKNCKIQKDIENNATSITFRIGTILFHLCSDYDNYIDFYCSKVRVPTFESDPEKFNKIFGEIARNLKIDASVTNRLLCQFITNIAFGDDLFEKYWK
jgi:hypothetical protein